MTVRMPDFYLLGAAKAGTTSLASTLRSHPGVFVPGEKELHVFDSDSRHADLETIYSTAFRTASAEAVVGDCTPSYLQEGALARDRLKEVSTGEERFLVLLRDPVDRAFSHYQHIMRVRPLDKSFIDAFRESRSLRARRQDWTNFYSDGLYAEHLGAWFEAFDRSAFLVRTLDELSADPAAVLRDSFVHLGVDPDVPVSLVRENEAGETRSTVLRDLVRRPNALRSVLRAVLPRESRRSLARFVRRRNVRAYTDGGKPVLAPEERLEVTEAYRHDVSRLEALLGRRFDWFAGRT